MARKIFSTYPLTMLKQTWDELYSLGEIEEKWLAHRNDLGHVMENPPPYKTEAQPTMHYSPALMMVILLPCPLMKYA